MLAHFLATQAHWLDHLGPVYAALPDEHRGRFFTFDRALDHAVELGLPAELFPAWPRFERTARLVVAAESDRRRMATTPVIRFEHGVGGSFAGSPHMADHPSYAGGRGQLNVRLFCCPNTYSSRRWREAYPKVPVRIVGTPKMDPWHNAPPKPRASRPVVCISFHFDANVTQETKTAFYYYRDVIPEVARRTDIEFVAHAHPKARKVRQPFYEGNGIEFIPNFSDVLDRADLYVIDSFSTLYEFASTDRPVVVLNQPAFRRTVNHGLRFWEHSDVGVNCDRPGDLSAAIDRALEDPPEQRDRRRRISDLLYPYRGQATQRAADVIAEHFAERGVKV